MREGKQIILPRASAEIITLTLRVTASWPPEQKRHQGFGDCQGLVKIKPVPHHLLVSYTMLACGGRKERYYFIVFMVS